jgi:hypothetical protein
MAISAVFLLCVYLYFKRKNQQAYVALLKKLKISLLTMAVLVAVALIVFVSCLPSISLMLKCERAIRDETYEISEGSASLIDYEESSSKGGSDGYKISFLVDDTTFSGLEQTFSEEVLSAVQSHAYLVVYYFWDGDNIFILEIDAVS